MIKRLTQSLLVVLVAGALLWCALFPQSIYGVFSRVESPPSTDVAVFLPQLPVGWKLQYQLRPAVGEEMVMYSVVAALEETRLELDAILTADQWRREEVAREGVALYTKSRNSCFVGFSYDGERTVFTILKRKES